MELRVDQLYRHKRRRRNTDARNVALSGSRENMQSSEGDAARSELSHATLRDPSPSRSMRGPHRQPAPLTRPGRTSPILAPLLACLLAALLLQLPTAAAAGTTCLRFADYDVINGLFTSGGPGTVVQLCPSKTYRMSGPIIFTAADQEITTFGHPTDDTRATIRMQGNGETAIQGDCRRCKGVKVRNLVIDGNRRKLGRSSPSEEAGALVILGGNEGQVVQNCEIRDPRGFTAIHVREGNKLDCAGVKIIGNVIGPVGEEYDPKRDGDDPELSPLGRPLADGITLACRDSIIKDNTIVDNTAAGIVLYCSPGTVVENNTITAETASAMAGILMVDAIPFKADYTGVIVRDNMVAATGAAMRIGIGIGPTVWSDDTETVLKGGSVLHNTLSGTHMGYGIAAAGLSGWTITDNVNEAEYEGRRGDRCFPEMVNPDPQAFVYTQSTMKDCKVQEDFVDAPFQYAACLDPVDPKDRKTTKAKVKAKAKGLKPPAAVEQKVQKPQADADSKIAVPAGTGQQKVPAGREPRVQRDDQSNIGTSSTKTAAHGIAASMEKFDTGSDVMDGILEHSRTRLLEAIEQLGGRVDGLLSDSESTGTDAKPAKRGVQAPAEAAQSLQVRAEALEKDQRRLVEEATGLRTGMQIWNQDMTKVHAWEHEILLDIKARLHDHFSSHPSEHVKVTPGEHHDDHSGHEANQAVLEVPHDQAGRESKSRGTLRQRAERARLLGLSGMKATGEGSWATLGLMGLTLSAMAGLWRWWVRRGARSSGGHMRASSSAPTLGSSTSARPAGSTHARTQSGSSRFVNGAPTIQHSASGWTPDFRSKGNHRKEL